MSCWSTSPVAEGCGFLNMVHFSPLKESFRATNKISVEQKYPFPSSPLLPKGFWEFQLHAFWQSQRQQGSQSLVWGLQVENMLHTWSAQHSKPDISSQLIICIKIPLLAVLPLEARW